MYDIALAIGHNFEKSGRAIDRGAVGGGTSEADTTKKIIDAIVKRGIPGFNIIKVPEGLGIDARNKWVNDRKSTLEAYFEFHLDSAVASATGVTTYFVDGNKWAEGEARQFQMEYTRITGLKGRGVKSDAENRWGRLGAIHDIKVFWLLMELGFISNPTDLKTIQTKGVEAIIAGIQKMFAS